LKCTICEATGRAVKVQLYGEELVSSLCVAHDAMCAMCVLEDDFTPLAEIVSKGSNGVLSLEESFGPARVLAGIRMAAYGISPQTLQDFAGMLSELSEETDELDLEMRILNFLIEKKLVQI